MSPGRTGPPGARLPRAACAAAPAALAALLAAASLVPAAAAGSPPQEADAVSQRAGQPRAPDTVPSRSSSGVRPMPPMDSTAGSGPSGEELDALTAEVAARLRCPVCRSQSVLESSATLSQQMQREIRRRLAAGQSPEEVEAYFVSRYGEWILLKPEPEGINLLVYLLPAAALLGGGLLVWSRLRAWTGSSGRAEAGPGGGGDEGRADRPSGEGADGLSPEAEERIDALIRERETGGG